MPGPFDNPSGGVQTGGGILFPQAGGISTPAPIPGTTGITNQVDQQKQNMSQLLQQIIARSQSRSQLPQGSPAPVPQQSGFQTRNNYGGGANSDKAAFAHNLAAFIHNSVAQKKETDIRKAQADWQVMENAWERAQMQAGDPAAPDYQQKVAEAFKKDPLAAAMLSDPKKMKNMAKALQMDWLNPEKTENQVYKQALNRNISAMEQQKAIDQLKDKMANRISQSRVPSPSDPSKQIEFVLKQQEVERQHQVQEQQRQTQLENQRMHYEDMAQRYAQMAEQAKANAAEAKRWHDMEAQAKAEAAKIKEQQAILGTLKVD